MRSDLMPITLKPADYTPDMPIFENPGSGNIQNCIPLTPNSYGPFASLSTFGSAIGGQCLGAIAAEDSSGDNYVFAGTATDLYEYTSSEPVQVSQNNGGYTLAGTERWRFLQFGQRLLATDFDDAIQTFTLGSSTKFSDLANGNIVSLAFTAGSGYTPGTYALSVTNPGSGVGFTGTVTVSGGGSLEQPVITANGKLYPQTATIGVPAGAGSGSGGTITPTIQTIAPNARYMAAIDGFCIVANTDDGVNGAQPQRVWWSALNDPTNWPTPGSSTASSLQSSYNDLFGDGGWNMGIIGNLGNADGAVFQERAVWRLIYSGPPGTFAFLPAEGVKGCPAPTSIIHLGPIVYYWAQDGIYKFDGSVSTPVGANRVDRTIYSLLDFSNIHRVDGAVDPTNKMIYWAFPSISNSNGNPDTILAYNWVLNKFSIITSQTLEAIFYSMSFGTTLADMPGGNLSQINIPLASRQWTGGTLILSGFNTAHELSYFNGSYLAATIDTQEIQGFPGQMTFVQNTRPLVDGGLPTVALAARNRLIDTSSFNTPQTITSVGTCPNTINGRYVKAETFVPAMSSWTHYQGVEIEAIPNGVQ